MTFCVNMTDETWPRYPSLRSWIHEAADDTKYRSDSHSAAIKVQTKFWQGDPIPWTSDGLWYDYAAILQCNIVVFPIVLNGFTNTWMSAPFTNGPDRGFMPPSFFAPPDGIPARFTAYIANFNEFVSDELGRKSLRSYHYAPLIVPISNWAQRQFTGQCGSLPTIGWTKEMGYFASVGALMGSAARPEGNRPLSAGDISLRDRDPEAWFAALRQYHDTDTINWNRLFALEQGRALLVMTAIDVTTRTSHSDGTPLSRMQTLITKCIVQEGPLSENAAAHVAVAIQRMWASRQHTKSFYNDAARGSQAMATRPHPTAYGTATVVERRTAGTGQKGMAGGTAARSGVLHVRETGS
jgi:hypothetical protein